MHAQVVLLLGPEAANVALEALLGVVAEVLAVPDEALLRGVGFRASWARQAGLVRRRRAVIVVLTFSNSKLLQQALLHQLYASLALLLLLVVRFFYLAVLLESDPVILHVAHGVFLADLRVSRLALDGAQFLLHGLQQRWICKTAAL